MKVFLDTNVLAAAFATRGLCADLVRYVLAEHQLITGDVVLDELRDVLTKSLAHRDTYEGGRHLYETEVRLDNTGPFGYNVRILPSNPLLISSAELGLVAWPPPASRPEAVDPAAGGS